MSINNCDFCDELSGGNDNAFVRIYRQQPESRVLFRSENFAVVPSLGQVTEGYLLIVPVSHYTALADMPPDLITELLHLNVQLRIDLSKAYGPCLFFEHGIRGKQAGGCGIDHAHMHAVPFTCSREPIEELKRNHSLRSIGGIGDIHREVSPNSPYLYYEETNGQAWTCEIGVIPSQYIRKLLAESLGVNSWDWRECGREQALVSSLARLAESFSGHESGSIEDLSLPSSPNASADAYLV